MTRNDTIAIPVTLALLLHVSLFTSLVFGLSFSRTPPPRVPLSIDARLVMEDAVVVAPPPAIEDEPESALVIESEPETEPEIVEPDPTELERIAAEAEKRRQDALIEQQRLDEIEKQKEEAERQRKAEEAAERQRKAEEEARRKREAEEEQERRRIEAERQREEDIRRQREENERRRREAEATERQAEIDAESQRIAAVNAGARDIYIRLIQQKIERNWVKPASARPGLECEVVVRQLPGGDVVSASIVSCNGDAAVQRSIEAAVFKASPLPEPSDPSVFERNLRLIFKPEQ